MRHCKDQLRDVALSKSLLCQQHELQAAVSPSAAPQVHQQERETHKCDLCMPAMQSPKFEVVKHLVTQCRHARLGPVSHLIVPLRAIHCGVPPQSCLA